MKLDILVLFVWLLSSTAGCQRRAQLSYQQRDLQTIASATASNAAADATTFDAVFQRTCTSRNSQPRFVGTTEEPSSTRNYPDAERITLPKARSRADVTLGQAMVQATQAIAATTINLQALSDLLYYSYGETGGEGGLRAAASAGALYPTDLFLSVRRVDGVARGIYYYDPRRHDLLRVAAAEPESPSEPPVSLIFGASADRAAFKYGARAPRYVPIDVGHVAANALLSAAALRLGCGVNTGLEERVVKGMIGLASDTEGVLLVLDCGTATPASVAPGQQLASLGARDLFETIAARRSIRQYREGSIARGTLDGFLLAVTLPIGVSVRSRRVEPWVFVHRVTDLAPGLYRYDVARSELISMRNGNLSQALADAGLGQSQLARAAFVLAWVPAEGFAIEQASGQDFRILCLEAGTMGELGYLAASALQFGACAIGAFYDDELGRLFGEGRRFPIHLLAVGKK